IRAKKQGVNLSIREAHALSNIPNLPDQFLNTAADLRKLDRNAYIGSLVDFHVAGGNLSNLKDGLEKIKSSGKDVSFNTLLLLNLAKKDVQEALDNIDKVYNVEVRDIEENNLSINYSCEFKVNFKDSFWVNPDMEQIKENVKTKISLALLSTNSNDENLEDFIKNKYLHRTFWREQANAIVLNHNIEITN
ncbi:MAG: hypothetical protein NWS46_07330, partial [Cyclobacteriaceae bacterium]|nr:hypothetical protein [Cyclobacteriaceae bacterium]